MRSSRTTVIVWVTATAKQSLAVELYATNDPTGTAPSFAVTAEGTSPPTDWQAGSWNGVYQNAGTYWTKAVTPLIGGSATTPAIVVAAASRYWLWSRTTVGNEISAELCGTIVCP